MTYTYVPQVSDQQQTSMPCTVCGKYNSVTNVKVILRYYRRHLKPTHSQQECLNKRKFRKWLGKHQNLNNMRKIYERLSTSLHIHVLHIHSARTTECFCAVYWLLITSWQVLKDYFSEQRHCGACRRKWRLTDTDLCPCGETQTMSHIVESCPLRPWQNWMAAYLGYTLRMKTLFRGWPVMVNDMHIRRRRRSARRDGNRQCSGYAPMLLT